MSSIIDFEPGPDGTYHSTGNGGGNNGGRWHDPNPSDDGGDEGSTWNTMRAFNLEVAWKIFLSILIIGGLTGLSLLINVKMGPWYVTIPIMVTLTIFIPVVLMPASLVGSAILGVFHAWLASERTNPHDLSQGALQGIQFLFDNILVFGLILLLVVQGFLATWPFAGNPGAFIYVFLGSLLIALVFYYFSLGGGRWFAWGVAIYAGAVIALALWSTLPSKPLDWGPFSYLTRGSDVNDVPIVDWSNPIQVGAGKESDPIWVEADSCFQPQLLDGAPNTTSWFRAHSKILPWESTKWIPNSGGEFRGIKLGKADKPFSFRYKVLPDPCR